MPGRGIPPRCPRRARQSSVGVSNVRVTRDATAGSYLRSDGQNDPTTQACSNGRRAQNEPTVAVDPHDTSVVVAGANDYCAAIINGDVWAGYYRSTDGGANWTDSLVPGYKTDASAAGLASPAHGFCDAAGDPTQAFDTAGRLFYGFICFNRSHPINGSIFVSTYDQDGAQYVRTVLLAEGTPSAHFEGLFEDKVNLAVDQTTGGNSGNVYVAWAQFNGSAPNNVVLFSRSTDHGQTFSRPVRLSPGLAQEEFTALAIGPDGAVYLTFRTFDAQGPTRNAIWLEKSVDGGVSFSEPRLVAQIRPFDSNQFSGVTGSDDCGDVPFNCPSGLTYSRFASLSAVAADTAGVHVVWNAELPSGQSKVFVRNSPDGLTWPAPAATLDTVVKGHQYLPDVASADGVITVVFYDSRHDPAYSVSLPPGDKANGSNSGGAVDTFVARSTDGGNSWAETQVTNFSSNYNWETHGRLRVPFWGDYIYISAVPGAVNITWTDSRNLVPGVDPRDPSATDGFDVLQCAFTSISDPCLSQGGLDQNVYGARV